MIRRTDPVIRIFYAGMFGGMKEMLYLCIEKSVITNNITNRMVMGTGIWVVSLTDDS